MAGVLRNESARGEAVMKAARLHAFNAALELDEVPAPEITGPFDVIVRVGGAGFCRTDLHIIEGWFDGVIPVELPLVVGHENAGWVQAVGPQVANLAVGDAVVLHPRMSCGMCRACRMGKDMHCTEFVFSGVTSPGGFAEYLKTSARAVVKLPPGVEPKDVAAHADAGVTAYHAAKKAAATLYPGAKAVIIGAGGVGHIGIQCLRALSPAEIVVVDKSPEALELARQCGADHAVVADGSHAEAVRELTDGGGAQVVLDFVGEGTVTDGVGMLAADGCYYVVGYGDTLSVPTIQMVLTETSFIGNLVGSYIDLVELIALVAQGKVTSHNRTYPLGAVNDVLDDLKQGRLQGRGILVPDGAAA
jgi:NAD+-dependent secondary alcohol dehydrogenase Adh1